MKKRFYLVAGGYIAIAMALGMSWYFVFFKDLYLGLGIYNLAEPIIPLGLASMIIQGVILAYFYPFFRASGGPLARGLKFGLLMGLYQFTYTGKLLVRSGQTTSEGTTIEWKKWVTRHDVEMPKAGRDAP